MSDLPSTSKRPTTKTKPLSTVDIENELCNLDISFSDDDDSFNSTSSSESDSENDFDEVSANNDTNILYLYWDTVKGTNQKNFTFNEVENI